MKELQDNQENIDYQFINLSIYQFINLSIAGFVFLGRSLGRLKRNPESRLCLGKKRSRW